jgi:uncharacterized protein
MIAGGTGFIGRALIKKLETQHDITIITRSHVNDKDHLKAHTILNWNTLQETANELLQTTDVIINLCGENIGKKSWSKKRKKLITDSRIIPTHTIMLLCKQCNVKPTVIHANGIGIYGASEPTQQKPFTEDTNLHLETDDFITQLAQKWEHVAYSNAQHQQRIVTLRQAVVCDPSGGVIKKMSLPFKLGLGGRIGKGNQPFPWISLNDVVRAIEFLINNHSIHGPVNLIAPNSITQKEFSQAYAKFLWRPAFIPMPAFIVKLLFGEMGKQLLLQGQIAWPKKLLESGFKFEDETIQQALNNTKKRKDKHS